MCKFFDQKAGCCVCIFYACVQIYYKYFTNDCRELNASNSSVILIGELSRAGININLSSPLSVSFFICVSRKLSISSTYPGQLVIDQYLTLLYFHS